MSVSLADLIAQMLEPPPEKKKPQEKSTICPMCKVEEKPLRPNGMGRYSYCKKCASIKMKQYKDRR